MQAVLDRRNCRRLQSSCEACFGEHLRKVDFECADCALSVTLDRRAVIHFKIYDRNGAIKELIVNPENRLAAERSWIALWEEQAGPVI